MTYYDYMAKEQKSPWWGAVLSAPFKLLGAILGAEKDTIDQHKVNTFELTKEQTIIAQAINKKVVCDVDKKTMVITINVTDQDPLIAATMADSVQRRLQKFITDYRTKKAKVDLAFTRKIYDEAKARYVKARQLYASFSDANQDIVLESVRSKQTDLENDMQLQFNAYSALAQQLQAAEAKVQQETPAFTTLQSATVPVKKSGPKRAQMVLIFLFLAFLGTTVWILHKENQLKPLLGL
jgi:capsule polysaccharide export protein KpsE/RkpR